MKNKLLIVIVLASIIVSQNAFAQDKKDGYKFKMVKNLNTTDVRDQYRSGTCWSFAANSFIESEMIRLGKEKINLSEMWVVRNCYHDKAIKYARFHGKINLAGGGALHDNFYVIKNYGIVPENVYAGLNYGTEKHTHGEFDAVLKGYMDKVIQNKNKKLSKAWIGGFDGILDSYLGSVPETFEYNGKSYTPQTFAKEVVGINPDNYIGISSFTHQPYHEPFIIEVPDNWLFGEVYNVELDEMIEIIDNSINNGYTVAWSADISEKGFSWKNGVAIVPEVNFEEMNDTEKAKWSDLSSKDKEKMLYKFEGPTHELVITPEVRQEAFDNYQTTDDHSMHIVGIAKDQDGNKFYYVKNSWNDNSHIYDGYLYVSEAFMRYKTLSYMIHKDALPKEIKSKLNL